ncbi:MAG: bi-domain-containing oxidoreductase [Gammaproteobacteria bacterium]|nr:bi-domain-containing oxidoreductase [Gammaproteobacteria bacterium]
MKQILQSLKTGETLLEEIPCPKNSSGSLLIETTKTLISAGTERMLLEFGKANILQKIKQQPDKVKMVLEKIKTDGFMATMNAVQAKLDQPIPLGYCNVGRVLEIGNDTQGFSVGDRVVSNGNHAEIVRVPKNLCAKIPDNVSDESAAFTVVSAIALQGIRLSKPTLGECYVVIGLGLIGLLAVQLLRAHGVKVLGVDFDTQKCELAKKFGADTVNLSQGEDLISYANIFSKERMVDAVIITAATKSNALLHQAATICRKRGRIILVGVIGNEFSRADFYEKELTLQVSCSYGPGRYDDTYEKKGIDYPIGYVRWTEQRNFEAVLDMMSMGVLETKSLISNDFNIDHVVEAYSELENNKGVLGILIHYPESDQSEKLKTRVTLEKENTSKKTDAVQMGFIGSGNYGSNILAPAFKKAGVKLHTVVSSQGISAKQTAKKLGFEYASSDEDNVYDNDDINCVVISTRHNLHANQVVRALRSHKAVFVEKPLAINITDLAQIKTAYESSNQLLMIGFNRRFSPLIKTIKKLITPERTVKTFIITVNAGMIPKSHWSQDANIGGGRIIGEACHFIDLMRYLAGCSIARWHAVSTGVDDQAIITLTFIDGSCGTINYFSNGHKSFPKERIEIFCNGKILQLDNFRKLIGFGWKNFTKQNFYSQNKGQNECVDAFVDAIENGKSSPIPFDEIMEVSRIAIEVAECIRN